MEPRTDADSPRSVPRSLALGGMSDDVTGSDRTARPEVNKNTLYLGQNRVFLFNLNSKGTYLHAGHSRRPNDVAPLNCLVYLHKKDPVKATPDQ